MIKVPFRGVLVSLLALVAAGGLVASNVKSENVQPSIKEGICKDLGTTLVVDFGDQIAASTITKCISNFNGSGWQLLKAAGFEVAGTSEYPDSFVCRINNFPNSKAEDCVGTPGSSGGRWVYFYSSVTTGNATKSWSRSPVGAAARKPKCGEFEGWLFITEKADRKVPAITPKPFSCK